MGGYDGLVKYIGIAQDDEASAQAQKWAGQFFSKVTCPECGGARLNREALHFKLDGKNISELANMDIEELYNWTSSVLEKLSTQQSIIATEILKEINGRLRFLIDVGLNYLSLNRASASLSGG